ncbi:HesB/IscA family protein [Bradyrhizobium sp. DASA03120]|uniref:HesB/IscA family protein n=1 Tax=Bradyrhizobium sp. SMVTL-02 TaxID=3395917 RepID=UPI003F71BB65
MIDLTETAQNAVKSAICTAAQPVTGLRIMVEGGGCAGFKYTMGLAEAPKPDDTVIERGGIKLFIAKDSCAQLAGTTIDFVVSLKSSGFTFDNPNAKSNCSCGRSFS